MSTPQDRPKRPTPAEIAERAELVEAIDAASKGLRTKRQARKAIDDKIEAYLRHADPKNTGWKFGGWKFDFETVKQGVIWASRFPEFNGPDLADQCKAEAGTKTRLRADRVGS